MSIEWISNEYSPIVSSLAVNRGSDNRGSCWQKNVPGFLLHLNLLLCALFPLVASDQYTFISCEHGLSYLPRIPHPSVSSCPAPAKQPQKKPLIIILHFEAETNLDRTIEAQSETPKQQQKISSAANRSHLEIARVSPGFSNLYIKVEIAAQENLYCAVVKQAAGSQTNSHNVYLSNIHLPKPK
ncbi:hypothetical protein PGT21_005492 [Puccinia graminis f. sp. tritici]|uniref:Uncharacterized protein n=1 Tax=Puccinia graminis f. sp. tritici TaxID=56615 RepID=A0A5B0P3K1_PUCGR|nr:hypothetical protein PGT21_005492 [Puccinia graminis f. sp. tritici]KAA1104879.1 hypothetical protein PGTUg99_003025 [Puccinia graminis f. sp. tritici]